jgi:hypothetical protein
MNSVNLVQEEDSSGLKPNVAQLYNVGAKAPTP